MLNIEKKKYCSRLSDEQLNAVLRILNTKVDLNKSAKNIQTKKITLEYYIFVHFVTLKKLFFFLSYWCFYWPFNVGVKTLDSNN